MTVSQWQNRPQKPEKHQVEQSEVGLYSLADAVSRVCEELGVSLWIADLPANSKGIHQK